MNSNEALFALKALPRCPCADFNAAIIASREQCLGTAMPALHALAKQIAPTSDPSDWEVGRILELDLLHLEVFLLREKDERARYAFVAPFLSQTDGWSIVDDLASHFKIKDLDLAYRMSLNFSKNSHPWVRRFAYSHLITSAKRLTSQQITSLIVFNEAPDVAKAEAWLLAEGLIYHEEALQEFLRNCPDVALKRRAIQKAVESFRISPISKDKLKSLR